MNLGLGRQPPSLSNLAAPTSAVLGLHTLSPCSFFFGGADNIRVSQTLLPLGHLSRPWVNCDALFLLGDFFF